MSIYTTVHKLLTNNLPRLRKNASGWQTANCPFCVHRGHTPDTRGRFGLLESNQMLVLHCFNCGLNTKYVENSTLSKDFQWVLTTIGVSKIDIDRLNFAARQLKSTPLDIKVRNITDDWVEIEKPESFLTIKEWISAGLDDENFMKVLEYAYSRNILDENLMMWSPDPLFAKRLIIPFHYNKKFVGYTARYFSDTVPKGVNKYHAYTPNNFIYNLDKQDRYSSYMTIHEGVLDAYAVSGVSFLGKEIKADQLALLKSYGSELIYCPDNDKDGIEGLNRATKLGISVSFPNWDPTIKDAHQASNIYGKILTLRTIIDSREENQFKIKMKKQIKIKELGIINETRKNKL